VLKEHQQELKELRVHKERLEPKVLKGHQQELKVLKER
jgi:hypothetical protein